nr:iroquois-class homeodomain protein IRX-1 [Vulpes vulpes]
MALRPASLNPANGVDKRARSRSRLLHRRGGGRTSPSVRGGDFPAKPVPTPASKTLSRRLPGCLPRLKVFPNGAGRGLALEGVQGSQYELKDNPGVHPATFAAHTAPAYYPYGQFQYGDPGRPKNATRESTSTLKAWLNEHRKNPYPTKGEKIMLAIITKMTLTQVSTWFANARRRLKKENKVTWGARSKDQEDGALFGSDTEGDPEKAEDDEEIDLESIDIDKIDEHDGDQSNEDDEDKAEAPRGPPAPTALARDQGSPLAAADALKSQDSPLGLVKEGPEPGSTRLLSPGAAAGGLQGAPHSKPKIWSLAETATNGPHLPAPPPPPQPQPPVPVATGVLHGDKASARSSPALPERDLVPRPDSPAQQLKSPFQPVRDNSLAPQEGTPRILAALPSA